MRIGKANVASRHVVSSMLAPPALPWRSSPPGGSLCCRSALGRRTGTVPRHSRASCGPGTAWPADTSSDSRLCSRCHRPVAQKQRRRQTERDRHIDRERDRIELSQKASRLSTAVKASIAAPVNARQ